MTRASTPPAWIGALLACCAIAADKVEQPSAEGVEFFEKRVRPLLVQHCYECHSAQAEKVKGKLFLDTRDGTRHGGISGPAVKPGDPAKSLLIQAVRYEDDNMKMPPKGKLSAAEIADLEAWVKMGAPDPRTGGSLKPVDLAKGREFWSFQPMRDVAPPKVKDAAWALNDIDRFVLARLEAKGLRPVPVAEKRTLIRRATFDLIGLPPMPDEIENFLKDESPQAYEKLIDRLLASPAYGERWGRHWLDVVRYADTAGDNSDYPIPNMYRYRNWVIDAFNQDVPYDRFVKEQLAGDLMPADGEQDRFSKLVATGYLANARRFGSYEDARYPWHLTIEDTIDNLGRAFLGLTVGCARCHDHKFDPLTAEDYYALYGFFQSTRYPWPGIELDKAPRDLVALAPTDEIAAFQKERQEKLASFDAEIKRVEKEKADADRAIKEGEKIADEDEKKARITEATKRSQQLYNAIKAARKKREDYLKKKVPFEQAYAVAEGVTEGKKKVGNACVQLKGDPERPGKEVPRRFPTVLGGQTLPADAKGSGRLELAKWLTEPGNPLTARVMVNRIWQYHFGRGIVPTPNNLGKLGRPPTHPELLDYLARRFVRDGWSVKAMHRHLMLSRTYQLSSRDDEANAKIDPGNENLWRFNRRRLDGESIRDALLVVGGNLDRSTGGPHPFPDQKTWDFTQHKPFKAVYETNRRSVYLMTQRIQRHPVLGLFDAADANASTDRRDTSTTSLQALYLMNAPFVHEQARKFSLKLLAEKSEDSGRVGRAFAILFGRRPTDDELTHSLDYLASVRDRLKADPEAPYKAWESLARALLLSNEFVYVD